MKKHFLFKCFTALLSIGFSFVLRSPIFATKLDSVGIKKPVFNNYRNHLSSDYGMMLGALKHYNLGIHYHISYQALKALSFQAGAAFNYFQYDIYSTSDQHRLSIAWLPITIGSRLNLISTRDKKYTAFLCGKTGFAIALANESNAIKSKPYYEYGIGATRKGKLKGNKFIMEIGFQNYNLSGEFTSSFQSTIDYNLNFQSFLLRMSLIREI